jgi:hypothetical protein
MFKKIIGTDAVVTIFGGMAGGAAALEANAVK